MFEDSVATTIYVGDNWDTSNVKSSSDMFCRATNLVGGNGTVFDAAKLTTEYAQADTATNVGYFTLK